MPIAVGIMQDNRFSTFATSTAIMSIFPSSPATCGDTIIANITLTNLAGMSFPNPSGTVNVVDGYGNIVGSGTITNGVGTINLMISASTGNYHAQFLGGVSGTNNFLASNSFNQPYAISLDGTFITFTAPPTFPVFTTCYLNSITVTAAVGAFTPPNPSAGTVSFRLYTNDTNFIALPNGTVDGTHTASTTIVGGSVVPSVGGTTYWLQAIYNGSGCYASVSSQSGESGLPIILVNQDTTTTTLNAISPSIFCINQSNTVSGTVSGTLLPAPSGTITVVATELFTSNSITMASGAVVSGNYSLTVPANIFSGQTSGLIISYQVKATFTPSSTCYGSSQSGSPLRTIKVFSNNPTNATITSPASGYEFCISQSQEFIISITSGGGTGNPSEGSITLLGYQNPSNPTYITLGTGAVSSGMASITVSGNTFNGLGGWFVKAVYNGTVCFASSSSPGGTSAPQYTIFDSSLASTSTGITSPSSGTELCCKIPQSFVISTTCGTFPNPNSGTITLYAAVSPFAPYPIDWTVIGTAPVFNSLATVSVPANTLGTGATYFIRDHFDGGTCYSNSDSPGGSFGYVISTYSGKPSTTTIFAPPSGTTLCRSGLASISIQMTTSATGIPAPTIGNVSLYYSSNPIAPFPSAWTLIGSGSPDGAGFVVIPIAITIPAGSISFKAAYTDSFGCYNNSNSATYFLNINNC